MANQKAFYFNSGLCIGCKACQTACVDKNDLPLGVLWRRVFEYGGGSWMQLNRTAVPNNVFLYHVSTSCQHCQHPLCMEVCPAAAISKRPDGIVLIDPNKCLGCRYCEWACPYGAPQFNEAAGVMTKCNFCYDLQDQGFNPACVDACVMRCLDFGDIDELRQKYGDFGAIEPLPSDDITNPSLVITPHRHAQRSGEGVGVIVNLSEEV
jgi:anaerobic dimethyl sulfoxide reductase subunit B (iron-sulfur subunit)